MVFSSNTFFQQLFIIRKSVGSEVNHPDSPLSKPLNVICLTIHLSAIYERLCANLEYCGSFGSSGTAANCSREGHQESQLIVSSARHQ